MLQQLEVPHRAALLPEVEARAHLPVPEAVVLPHLHAVINLDLILLELKLPLTLLQLNLVAASSLLKSLRPHLCQEDLLHRLWPIN